MCHFRTRFDRAPISARDYYDSMITRISNIDLSSQPSRHFARALAQNNIVPPSDRQIKFVDVLRFDLPLHRIGGEYDFSLSRAFVTLFGYVVTGGWQEIENGERWRSQKKRFSTSRRQEYPWKERSHLTFR